MIGGIDALQVEEALISMLLKLPRLNRGCARAQPFYELLLIQLLMFSAVCSTGMRCLLGAPYRRGGCLTVRAFSRMKNRRNEDEKEERT